MQMCTQVQYCNSNSEDQDARGASPEVTVVAGADLTLDDVCVCFIIIMALVMFSAPLHIDLSVR